MRNETAPLLYIVIPDGYASLDYAYIRLRSSNNKEEAISKVLEILNEMDPGYPFEIQQYDEILGILYNAEVKQGKVISIFSFLAAVLSLVGIFGQVLLDVQYRRRDIAVRKVYGAEIGTLIGDGIRRYFILVLASFALAAPVAWYAVTSWQAGFVERVELSPVTFILAFATIALLTLAIVAFQYWRAATIDPADILQKE